MAEDRRRFRCPTCGRAVVQIGKQCGFCGKFCTEARVRGAEGERDKQEQPAAAKGEWAQCRMAL